MSRNEGTGTMGGYTVGELERDTGFSRRTIAYYVQLGLLPRVGRLGPKTRYPEQVRDRLRFIRRVREAQAAGEVPPVSLSDIGDVFDRAPPELISGVAAGRTPVTPEIFSPPGPRFSAPSRRRDALQDRLDVREVREASAPYARARASDPLERYGADSLASFAPPSDVLREREPRAYSQRREAGPRDDPELAELLATVEEAAELLETLGRRLRRVLRRGQDSMS
ncbi:MerR family transcriptional regulator [Candidatus Palauibacter sp.]|uniref:MerR family transcriptional regulator n=1 Tax=Candidatus Palauibacter sp. TaxID=3101350 RepID=UPI003B5CF963